MTSENLNTQTLHRTYSGKAVKRVFAWATGQDDNIGDSLLRRAYLDFLRELGPLEVWVGAASEEFIPGLTTNPADVVTHKYWAWIGSVLRSALNGRTVVALNAGEVKVSRRGAMRLSIMCLLILACKIRGGGGIWIGAGVPNSTRFLAIPYKLAARLCTFVRWRDRSSVANMGREGVGPDWAFRLGTTPDDWARANERSDIGLVLRGDRPMPSAEWFAWFESISRELRLRPIAVVQVKRDEDRAVQIARDHLVGISVLAWTGKDHAAQEATVREAYKRCAIVVGDRLHGLIVAATEGAVPLGWVESSGGKIRRHFDAVELAMVGSHEGAPAGDLPRFVPKAVDGYRAALFTGVSDAREAIDALESAAAVKFGSSGRDV